MVPYSAKKSVPYSVKIYAHIRLIDDRVWIDKDGKHQEESIGFSLSIFGKQAEYASQHIGKGSAIAVRCHLRPSKKLESRCT